MWVEDYTVLYHSVSAMPCPLKNAVIPTSLDFKCLYLWFVFSFMSSFHYLLYWCCKAPQIYVPLLLPIGIILSFLFAHANTQDLVGSTSSFPSMHFLGHVPPLYHWHILFNGMCSHWLFQLQINNSFSCWQNWVENDNFQTSSEGPMSPECFLSSQRLQTEPQHSRLEAQSSTRTI